MYSALKRKSSKSSTSYKEHRHELKFDEMISNCHNKLFFITSAQFLSLLSIKKEH